MRSPPAAMAGSPSLRLWSLALLLVLVQIPIGTSAFVVVPAPAAGPSPPPPVTDRQHARCRSACGRGGVTRRPLSASSNSDGTNDIGEDEFSSPQPSSGIIEEMADEEYSTYTHLVAIPLETNHDLLLELESIQRAVLYNCPLLINAVITPELTRMPMLYVNVDVDAGKAQADGGGEEESIESPSSASSSASSASELLGGRDIFSVMRNEGGNGDDGDASSSSSGVDQIRYHDPVTAELHSIVEDVIAELIYSKTVRSREEGEGEGAEAEEAEPVLMAFRGLEMDGDSNEVPRRN